MTAARAAELADALSKVETMVIEDDHAGAQLDPFPPLTTRVLPVASSVT